MQVKEMMEDLNTILEMLYRLREAGYSSKSFQNRLRFEQNFRSFKICDEKTFREYLNEINFILGKLKDVGIIEVG